MLLMFVLLSQISICLHAFEVDFESKVKTGEEINGLAKQLMRCFLYFRVHQERKAVRRRIKAPWQVGWQPASVVTSKGYKI